jgi:TetR/AcrR family transcriptional repressor of nem operon
MAGRPRQFDEDQVLEQAMNAFWAHGFESTSMARLVEVTGLHKGSLYQAFGNKHTLFIKSLERYLQAIKTQKEELLASALTPLEGITSVLHRMLEIANDDESCPRGCLAVNVLVELSPHDPEVRLIIDKFMDETIASMSESVSAAQQAGQITKQRLPEQITALLMTFMSGLATQMKGRFSKTDAHELLNAQIESCIR